MVVKGHLELNITMEQKLRFERLLPTSKEIFFDSLRKLSVDDSLDLAEELEE